ncbi:uncharacterized GPI-anchored protein At1g61900 isoform X1 [Brachypodium distachyon]|uniref:Uncharacterized protein n=1 Tax=Brachypodium distachyon TaxID=15368 RepID=I1I5P0_BRADI|nr:uncharacterized GPI-anchored protein At1g61900 isoform X1 [Brachypodium distachyon]XP_010234943.1 uncharacterized GPI-anchored protein At1g61900 isoform X1 [Brachypodium distachyon]KQJ97579.1 hypothetical protein BRADI_3g32020v3 [Brachypodium distachyon]PNT67770.1 hypothetical protein BRADI_3g32020v3 [Brachypodium distachyon]|eukprot:XP_003574251.1 uncharacterized GPI-anchored protein At1g61900 isoform X1 [Brachypodium distachyon]
MESSSSGSCRHGAVYCCSLLFVVWLCGSQHVLSQKTTLKPEDKFLLSDPPIGLFDPIEISPSVLPHNANPAEPVSPMYPNYTSYDPILTGKCHVNFSELSHIMGKTASDCTVPLAPLVADVICCPQVNSLMNIFQAAYGGGNNTLVLNQASANACFSDIMSILASKGANTNIPELCTLRPTNLTDASCPVNDVSSFERIVNASKLLDACSSVDPLKECCRPACQPAIVEAAVHLSTGGASMFGSSSIPGSATGINVVSDCKGVVHSYLSMKLSSEVVNTAFRVLSGCKVNKVCPLEFDDPSSVVKACGNASSPRPSCCAALHSYIATRQKQLFVTNLQAINCATMFGSMLQKAGVGNDIYGLCDIDLKDFSLQAFGQQGCLLRSLPTDIVFDNITGISFTCDLSDNIAAPWPSSSSLQSLSLCAPEMSLPALPVSPLSGSSGISRTGIGIFLPLLLFTTIISI